MSSKQWFYMQNGQSNGPVSEDKLISMVRDGVLLKTSLIWTRGAANWKPIESLFEFKDEAPLVPPKLESSLLKEEEVVVDIRHDAPLNQGWSDITPHPWRRFFARVLDTYISGLIAVYITCVLLVFLIPDLGKSLVGFFTGSSGQLWSVLVMPFLAMFVNAAFIGFAGYSAGKWIFGIRILNQHNKPIGYFSALSRELRVWAGGITFGIPLFNLFAMSAAQKALLKDGKTTWDQRMNTKVVHRESGAKQSALGFLGLVMISFISAMLRD